MSVCRTCLFQLANGPKFSIDHIPDGLSTLTELNIHSNRLQFRKMIEKCMPEMDLDICDSPVICKNCYKLLMSAYKFRAICIHTEEKIYQFIEKNNLRLGESIDLSKLSEKNPHESSVIKIEDENETLKEETNNPEEFGEMPNLVPEATVVQNENETVDVQVLNVNEAEKRSKRNVQETETPLNNASSELDLSSNDNGTNKRPRRKVQNKNNLSYNSPSESDISSAESETNSSTRSEKSEKKSKYEKRCFTCDKCQYKASKWDLLKRHLKLKCGVAEPTKFKCDKCPYKTIRLRNLKRHQLTHGGPRPWVCGVCKKGYTEKSYLKYHMLKHQPDKPLPFKCQEEDCEYAAARNCDLTAHMLTHMKGYPFFCRVCKKMSFPTKVELVKHEKICKGTSTKKK